MKNKKLLYVLVPAFLSIWIIVFYQLFNKISRDPTLVNEHSQLENLLTDQTIVEDTFGIEVNYRDPFLGKMPRLNTIKSNSPIVKVIAKNIKKPPSPPIDFSFIVYKGMVENQNANSKVGIISIHRKEMLVLVGDSLQGVNFLKIFNDSILIAYQDVTQIIKKYSIN
ncbi:MAG: hypothetical protein IIA45_04295 [Bacteroidetes bacterium]|nr:hypothetical protein [Bacteroidota bacterium]